MTGLPIGYEVFNDVAAKTFVLRKFQSYAGWATSNGLNGNPNEDSDNDGLPDGIEYVLGTAPKSNSAASAPAATVTGGNLVFTFTRADYSMTDSMVMVEVGTLAPPSWSLYHVGATTASSSAGITVTDNGATDTITLSVPVGTDATKFARLRAEMSP